MLGTKECDPCHELRSRIEFNPKRFEKVMVFFSKPVFDPNFHGPPKEIIDAAQLVEMWMKKNGWRDWELRGVADRDLVTKLREKIEKLELELDWTGDWSAT